MNRLATATLAPTVAKAPASVAARPPLQRKCACGGNVGPTGECDACRRKRLAMQRKPALPIGAVDDPLEREADRMAEAVVRGNGMGAVGSRSAPKVQREPTDDGPGTGTLGFDLGPALARGTLPDRRSSAPQLRPAGPNVVEGFRVTGAHCGCAPVLEADIRWNETVMNAYRGCDRPSLTSANDLETCVRSRLPAARRRVPAAATADPETSTIEWASPERRRQRAAVLGQPESGPCADLITRAVTLHEQRHLQQFDDVAASLGDAFLTEFRRLAGQPDRMEQLRRRFPSETAEYERRRMFEVPASTAIQDELEAHQRNIDFHRAVLDVLSRLCQPPQPTVGPPPIERSYRRENLYQGRTEFPAERGEEQLQRAVDGHGDGTSRMDDAVAPPVVSEVLSRSGHSLEPRVKAEMEAGFSRDFSRVRLHTDALAAASAKAVNARAFTVGSDIVFAGGEYRPGTLEGRRLLAHELTHTLQQSGAAPLAVGPLVQRQSGGATTSAPSSTPAATAVPRSRGPNPGDCLEPLCRLLDAASVPSSAAEATQQADAWRDGALACIRGGSAGSNASNAAEIVANEESEIAAEHADLAGVLTSSRGSAGRREYQRRLREVCRLKQREVSIEFHYNVVFANPPGGSRWASTPGDWGPIEGALAELPQEATWGNPRVLIFERAACHPDDVDPTSGTCTGRRSGIFVSMTAGEAFADRNAARIYDAGLGATPFSRSRSLGVSTTAQTLRHEVGHLVLNNLSQADRDALFRDVMQWRDFSWDWITSRDSPHARWRAQRTEAMAALGFNDDAFDAWLAGLVVDRPVVVGAFTFTKKAHTPGSRAFYLESFLTVQMPTGAEFGYARTNQGEYLAELYALAISAPDFLHRVLPEGQIRWLKRVVFHTPEDMAALARQAALAEPARTQFILQGSRLFTREQLDTLLSRLSVSQTTPGAQLA
ncbi:MAG: DUF4157 domain-containing protein [Verrucomicrobiales bacterium]|nr:DUF4157 domain-containing protein [Verrucomicrobiales bacterium]